MASSPSRRSGSFEPDTPLFGPFTALSFLLAVRKNREQVFFDVLLAALMGEDLTLETIAVTLGNLPEVVPPGYRDLRPYLIELCAIGDQVCEKLDQVGLGGAAGHLDFEPARQILSEVWQERAGEDAVRWPEQEEIVDPELDLEVSTEIPLEEIDLPGEDGRPTPPAPWQVEPAQPLAPWIQSELAGSGSEAELEALFEAPRDPVRPSRTGSFFATQLHDELAQLLHERLNMSTPSEGEGREATAWVAPPEPTLEVTPSKPAFDQALPEPATRMAAPAPGPRDALPFELEETAPSLIDALPSAAQDPMAATITVPVIEPVAPPLQAESQLPPSEDAALPVAPAAAPLPGTPVLLPFAAEAALSLAPTEPETLAAPPRAHAGERLEADALASRLLQVMDRAAGVDDHGLEAWLEAIASDVWALAGEGREGFRGLARVLQYVRGVRADLQVVKTERQRQAEELAALRARIETLEADMAATDSGLEQLEGQFDKLFMAEPVEWQALEQQALFPRRPQLLAGLARVAETVESWRMEYDFQTSAVQEAQTKLEETRELLEDRERCIRLLDKRLAEHDDRILVLQDTLAERNRELSQLKVLSLWNYLRFAVLDLKGRIQNVAPRKLLGGRKIPPLATLKQLNDEFTVIERIHIGLSSRLPAEELSVIDKDLNYLNAYMTVFRKLYVAQKAQADRAAAKSAAKPGDPGGGKGGGKPSGGGGRGSSSKGEESGGGGEEKGSSPASAEAPPVTDTESGSAGDLPASSAAMEETHGEALAATA